MQALINSNLGKFPHFRPIKSWGNQIGLKELNRVDLILLTPILTKKGFSEIDLITPFK